MKTWCSFLFLVSVLSASAQKMRFNDETTTVSFSMPHEIMQLKGTFTGVNGSGLLDSSNLTCSFLKLSFASNIALHNHRA